MSKRSIKDYFSSNKKTTVVDSTDSTNINQDLVTNSSTKDNLPENPVSEVTLASSSKIGKVNRFYNTKWEANYPWLYFDNQRFGAFCKLCEKHVINDSALFASSGGIFVKTPFQNYKNALGKDGKLNKHTYSASHIRSVELEKLALVALKNPVYNQILSQNSEECKINRKHLSYLFRSVYFLVKEEIAHTTKYEPLIKRLIVKSSDSLQNWINAKSDRSTYTSKATASELLCCASEILDAKLDKEIYGKKFSLLADESTNINNKSELSICVRFVKNNQPVERFLNIVALSDTKAQTIVDAISNELIKHNLSYDNVIACGFDGASNMSGNKGGVRRFVSDKAGREVPYIHCRAHVLSLALTSMRNKFPKIKRVFHVLKDIYKLFHQSPKREELLHKIQVILNDPILKIPEATEIRWLSHYKIVHAVKQSYIAITTACEHIHQDGADLASLADGILLSLREESFIVLLCGLDEILGAISNLSLTLQGPRICISALPTLIKSTTCHLNKILGSLKQDAVDKSIIIKNATDISSKLDSLKKDYHFKETISCLSQFLEQTIKEMNRRFNDTALTLIEGCSIFEDYKSFSNSSEKIIEQLCDCFSLNENEKDGVLSDYKSFMFVASQKVKTNGYPITDLLEANIGYEHLKKLSESILCIPIGTPTVERSFSAMNRIMTNLRNRMGQDTLQYCMKISIEGDEDPPIEYVEEVIDLYATKKTRRIRFI